MATDQKVGSSNLLAHVLEPVGVCLQVFLCNKPSRRNRACTNFYRTANVHRADRRDGIDCTFEQTIGCSSIAESLLGSGFERRHKVRQLGSVSERVEN